MKMVTIRLNEVQEEKKEEKLWLAIEALAVIAIRAAYILLALYFFFQIEFEPEVMGFVTSFIVGCILCVIPARKFIKL